MAAIISENVVSRRFTLGNQAGRELEFDIFRTDDEDEVRALIVANAPPVYFGLIPESIEAEPLGGGVWKGRVKYVRFEDNNEFTFKTGGGTQKITQSRWTRGRYAPPGKTAPNFQGAIGVGKEDVEGCDIVVPKYEWSETHRFADEDVTHGYRMRLMHLTGRTNAARFRGLAQGECLFLGATGSKRGDELWSITFDFAGSPNEFGITIGGDVEPYGDVNLGDFGPYDEGPYGDPYGDVPPYLDDPDALLDYFGFAGLGGVGQGSADPYGYVPGAGYVDDGSIVVPVKRGWDYLWVRYADAEDGDAKAIVKIPRSVHVEVVYRRGDFSRLGIGVD